MTPEEREMIDMGLSVGRHLTELGHETVYFDVDNPDDLRRLVLADIDVAFTLSERMYDDSFGEAYVPAFLESFGIPHTGVDSSLSILAIDKPKVKQILVSQNIPTPNFQVFSAWDGPLDPQLKFPLIVKGATSDNSISIDKNSVVSNEADLRKRIDYVISRFKQPALVEAFIDGRELNVAILPGWVPIALPVSEIIFADLPPTQRIVDYHEKWSTDATITAQCPALLTSQQEMIVNNTALQCYRALNANSYARVDIRFKDNVAYVIEFNPNPSLGEQDCGYVNSARAYGLTYHAMVDAILKNALIKQDQRLA